MRTISRISTTYVPREDRLLLSAVDMGGVQVKLWLTQRLMTRLVPALVDLIEKSVPKEAPAAARPAMQAMEQTKADLQRQRMTPVRPEPAGEEHLVTNIGLRSSKKSVAVIFMWGEDDAEKVGLGIDRTRLRQWLRIFHEAYGRAKWPMDIWPEWFDDAAAVTLVGKDALN
ncbi:MAG: hypothetical protein KDE55_21370 [Novosphingobium sp.]|nr:hypothetical protein [Novosphingobium sp.]